MGDVSSEPILGSPHIDSAQEEFQRAYIHAVIAAARCGHYKPQPDHDGVDLGVRHWSTEGDLPTQSQIELQLKATRQQDLVRDGYISHTLSSSHYDALRTPKVLAPRYLVMTVVPEDYAEWLHQTEERLQMLRCTYYVSLEGRDGTQAESKTVRVPRENVFDVLGLCRLLRDARPDLRLGD